MTIVYSPNHGNAIGAWEPTKDIEIARHLDALKRVGLPSLAEIGERRALLERFASEIDRDRTLLADLVTDEVGKRPSEARDEIDYAIAFLREYIGHLETHAFAGPPREGRYAVDVGVGLALLITPFNDPIAGLTRKIGPAVAAGCPFILKPSPLGVLTAEAAMRCFERAGGGAIGKLVMTDDGEMIARLIAHDCIAIVSFTGSTATGRKVATAAGSSLKKSVLELGGNCPMLVLPDANLDNAVNDLVARKVRAAGQACSAINRVFLHESIAGRFRTLLTEKVSVIAMGPARETGIDLGPLRTPQAVERLASLEQQASGRCERVLARSAPAKTPTTYLFPLTVLEVADTTASVLDREEAFGPLIGMRAFGSSERKIAHIADERHALAVYVYGADAQTKQQIAERWRFGSIGFDTIRVQSPATPTGGFGLAGHGREGGVYGLREFLTTKNICNRI